MGSADEHQIVTVHDRIDQIIDSAIVYGIESPIDSSSMVVEEPSNEPSEDNEKVKAHNTVEDSVAVPK